MNRLRFCALAIAWAAAAGFGANQAYANNYYTQCPPDTDIEDSDGDGLPYNDNVCIHVSGSDGFLRMADGRRLYAFGFSRAPAPLGTHPITGEPVPVTGEPPSRRNPVPSTIPGETMEMRTLGSNLPAPTISVREGQKLYLTLSIVPMAVRPDLFDPHTVHFHGFPNASAIFDGVPDNSIAPNPASSMTYFYNVVTPGTFMWHCHVEASEHMQMGMLGNLYVEPKQNMTWQDLPTATATGVPYAAFAGDTRTYTRFAYNDGDGSTGYDVEYPIQIHSLDPTFHDASESVQPLPFANMNDTYTLLNGRGYPDTLRPDNDPTLDNGDDIGPVGPRNTQPVSSRVEATQGERILLRITSLSTTDNYTMRVLGIPMEVVGRGAMEMRGPTGTPLHYKTDAIHLGGGEGIDVILDTANVAPGTYFLYTTKLNFLSNDAQDFGGPMTEIVVNAAP